jgi:sugar phosphate isomerase/epimerase
MPTKLAAQLYSVRHATKTPADIATTLKKIRDIGYQAVQLSGLGPIDIKELKAILDDNELIVCATHTSYDRMRDELDVVMDEHRLLGCPHLAIGGMPLAYRNGEGYHRFAKEASEVARRAAAAGFTWSYHNHSFELEKFDGKTGLSILFDESDPSVFLSELDTYWVQHGGADPAQWISDLNGRIKLLHLKDMVIGQGKQLMAEVGEGNLNWPAILAAAAKSGVEWYIVEQDECQRDPFESLAISLRNLQAMGLS